MKSRTTMADIARRANVHVTTVSMALRNHRNLPTATIDRIKRLADEMGYRPDPALSALVSYRHNKTASKSKATIAYLTNWDSRLGWKSVPAHLRFFEGAKVTAEKLGYGLEHFWCGEPKLSQNRLNDMLQARGINGIVVASFQPNRDTPIAFDWSRFVGVKIDFFPSEPALHNVTNDQSAIIQLAFKKVRENGYRRIGMIAPKAWDTFVKQAWTSGYFVAQQSIRAKDRVPMLTYETAKDGDASVPREKLERWLERHKPDAIISYDPFVRQRLMEMQIDVPQDIGYADIFLENVDGKTAGVVNNCERVGEIAIETIVGQLQQNALGLPIFQTTTLVEGSWNDGATLPLRGA